MIELFNNFRDFLYEVLKFFQDLTEPVLGGQSYWFSIVLLTISVRILLIPLTVKQVRSTRVMSELAPEIKKLQAKHKNDRQKLNEEMMALYKERGFNPMAGCWPLLAQMPFFFALYQVIIAGRLGFANEANILRHQTFFGVPLEQHWWALQGADKIFSAAGITILLLTTTMSLTTYISQRQLMSRQAAQVNPQQQMLMRIMPLMFFVFAVNVPLALIIYWVTTNFWSVGQQYMLLRTAPAPAGAAGAAAPAPALVEEGGGRKGLGLLSLFRGFTQPRVQPSDGDAATSRNGERPARAGEGKAPAKPAGSASKGGQTKAGQSGRQGGGRQGTSGSRKSGSRSGKGKASGPRRGKR
ncbi:MAG TPA: YidC/Oxa1 family membrane protein insertase [Jiangellaceae bacterium]|nr:YidC/Oxa1 family membrane protein insertase [Jiangellaceae bacterium]